MDTINEYNFPMRKEAIIEIRRGESASPAHKDWRPKYGDDRNAIDFYCSEDTEILAAFDGEVKFVKDNSNIGGPDEKYIEKANVVFIKHVNGEHSRYMHLKYKGIYVEVGDKVKTGQPIGIVGRTGYCLQKGNPHLDFAVIRWTKPDPNTNRDYETLNVRFKNLEE
jgi:murein DD-endopeptidase MepM/ murein hydrolase activator NlpD